MLRHLGYADVGGAGRGRRPLGHRRGPHRDLRPRRHRRHARVRGRGHRAARRAGARLPPRRWAARDRPGRGPARAPQAPWHRPAGLRARPSAGSRGPIYPIVQGIVFTICAGYLTFSGVLWGPLFGPQSRGRRLPLAAVLAADPAPGHAGVAEPGPADPVDPDRLPGHLLLLPEGLLPLLLRGSARLRRRRADGPPPVRARERLPVHPPEPPPLHAVPGVHPAVLPVAGRHSGVHQLGTSAGRGTIRGSASVALFLREHRAAHRLLAVVPLAAAPRRRPDRLLLVHRRAPRSATRSGSA